MAFDGFPEPGLKRPERASGAALQAPASWNRTSRLPPRSQRTPLRLRKARRAGPEQRASLPAHDFIDLLNAIPGANEVPAVTCDTAEALAATARRARLAMPRAVTVDVSIPQGPLGCKADRTDLECALLSLCINAGHAMPTGGVLAISAEAAVVGGAAAEALGLQAGRYAVLSVRDSGAATSPQILARATEAYFTTRQGRGATGLGLSGVEAFAREAGGRLRLVCEEAAGTTATLYLPCS